MPGEDEFMDLGSGAGFYVNATQPPWAAHYQMYDYVSRELVAVVNEHLPVDPARKSISGHSMGGHGALVVGLRNAGGVSVDLGVLADLRREQVGVGAARTRRLPRPRIAPWLEFDASAVVRKHPSDHELLVDQGSADPYLDKLRPQDLQAACEAAGQRLNLPRTARVRSWLLLCEHVHRRAPAFPCRGACLTHRGRDHREQSVSRTAPPIPCRSWPLG